MSSGLRIKATGGIYNVGPVPKAEWTSGMGGIMPAGNTSGIVLVGNTDVFLGA